MKTISLKVLILTFCISLFCDSLIYGDDWNTGSGGKPSRHSLSTEYGPENATLLWQNGYNAIIAQQAVIDSDIVATSRIFNLNNVLHGTKIVAQELLTGDTLWTTELPVDFPNSDWRSRVSSFKDGVIYATRSGNTNYSYMYALDAFDGSIIWQSEGLVNESSTESSSFAPNGDLIVGNFESIIRINYIDGSTVWETSRSCPTSNGQELAVFENRGYYWEASPYGPKVSAIDLSTGNYLYSSDALSAGLIQQLGLFIGLDGIIYAPRIMNNPATDFLFALKDNGLTFEELWSVPLGYVPFATFGIGPDGTIYSYSTNGEVIRLDPENGNVLNTSQVILTGTSSSPRMAIDANGYVFVTNGEFATGAMYSLNPDLTLRWSENITNVNVGGPALGQNGTLIVCGVGTNVRAYEGSYSLQAGFSSEANEVCEDKDIQFFDQSNGNIVAWEWTFEGGMPAVSALPDPIVVYNEPGIYDVKLIVLDNTGSDTLLIEDYITVMQLPEVNFNELPVFCLDDPPYLLIEGEPEGGEYSGTGVIYGFFDPGVAGIGSQTLTYNYTNEYGCMDSANQVAIVNTCTEVHEMITTEGGVVIYPSPAKDILIVECQGENLSDARLEIYNSCGINVFNSEKEFSLTQSIYKISVSDWTPGMYVLLVYDNEKVQEHKKFIVQ